jgi:hypothetical protein
MCHQAPNVWVLQRHSDTLSQDLRASVGKCFALSPSCSVQAQHVVAWMMHLMMHLSGCYVLVIYIISRKLVVSVKVYQTLNPTALEDLRSRILYSIWRRAYYLSDDISAQALT